MIYKTLPLGQLCRIEKGGTGIMKAVAGPYPMVTLAEERTSHNEYQFDAKAVIVPLISSTGHGHASMKRLHYQEGKFALGSILCALIPKDEEMVNAEFLYHYLNFRKQQLFVPLMRGAANVSLSIKSISSVLVSLPPLEEQRSLLKQIEKIKILRSQVLETLGYVDLLEKTIFREFINKQL